MRLEPEREPWPLWPRVEVLPMPEPIPRPTRFLFSFAFLGARRLERLRIAIYFLAITPGRIAPDSLLVRPALLLGDVTCLAPSFSSWELDPYSTIRTRWGIFATMPRMDG